MGTATRVLARVLMGSTFVKLGYDSWRSPGRRTQTAGPLLEQMRGIIPLIPADDETLVRFNGAAQAVGGAALALGVLPRLAALGLIASLVPTSFAGHAFWKLDDEQQRAAQRTQFLKNMAMIGGLLLATERVAGRVARGARTPQDEGVGQRSGWPNSSN